MHTQVNMFFWKESEVLYGFGKTALTRAKFSAQARQPDSKSCLSQLKALFKPATRRKRIKAQRGAEALKFNRKK